MLSSGENFYLLLLQTRGTTKPGSLEPLQRFYLKAETQDSEKICYEVSLYETTILGVKNC